MDGWIDMFSVDHEGGKAKYDKDFCRTAEKSGCAIQCF